MTNGGTATGWHRPTIACGGMIALGATDRRRAGTGRGA
jgi:hypothetical protein